MQANLAINNYVRVLFLCQCNDAIFISLQAEKEEIIYEEPEDDHTYEVCVIVAAEL